MACFTAAAILLSPLRAEAQAGEPATPVTGRTPSISQVDTRTVLPGDSPVSDPERLALRIENVTLDMHLNTDTGLVTTRARLRARNGGSSPLARVALQVSSALTWQSVRVINADGTGSALPIRQFRVTTDTDHTGAANELVLTLPKALTPGSELNLDLYYSGTLAASTERLTRLGAPDARAAEADWDGVSPAFVGLRGFGNVLWYPVSAPAAILANGDAFAKVVSAERERTAATEMELSLSLEHTGSDLRTAWFMDRPEQLQSALHRREPPARLAQQPAAAGDQAGAASAAAGQAADASGSEPADPDQTEVDTALWDRIRLDGRPVSLFVAVGSAAAQADAGSARVQVIGGDANTQQSYAAAVDKLRPMLHEWLPARSDSALTLLALPTPGTQAFADGGLLVTPVHASDTAALAESLVYPLVAAAVPVSAPAWVRQGLPEFLRLLYLERTGGRDRMLAELQALSPALQQAEAARGMDPLPLRSCVDPVCARVKAAYALVMLRGLTGDAPLRQALQATLQAESDVPAGADQGAEYGRAMTRRFETALGQSSGKDLGWFFADWFSADRGLPDLQIVQVAPRRVERGATTVTEPTKRGPRLGPVGSEPQAEPDDPRRTSPTAASRNTAGLPDGSWLVAVEVQNNGDAAVEVPVTVRSAGLQNQLPLRIAAHGRATVRVPFEATPDDVWVNDGTTPEQHGSTHHRTIEITQQSR